MISEATMRRVEAIALEHLPEDADPESIELTVYELPHSIYVRASARTVQPVETVKMNLTVR